MRRHPSLAVRSALPEQRTVSMGYDFDDGRDGEDSHRAGDNARRRGPRGGTCAKGTEERGLKLTPFSHVTMVDGAPQLVSGMIPLTGLVVIWGAPKSGKSFKTFDLVMHVARGLEYRGRKVKQGPVAYCIFEGQTGFQKRIAAYRKHHRIGHVPRKRPYALPAGGADRRRAELRCRLCSA